MIKIYTIGVYNSTEDEFFGKLVDNDIDLFCDIRQRRGVRGSQYKFVNSNYLQNKLKEMGIPYMYIKALAPTSEIRNKQKQADKAKGETKRKRLVLGDVFKFEYSCQILDNYDMQKLATELSNLGVNNVVFFCVEEKASACHRSLVAHQLKNILNTNIIDL